MDYKFLHKVVDQIVSETIIDYDKETVSVPFHVSRFSTSLFSSSPLLLFSKHCRDVYGLNEQEIEYVWKVYSDDIVYKIKEEKYR